MVSYIYNLLHIWQNSLLNDVAGVRPILIIPVITNEVRKRRTLFLACLWPLTIMGSVAPYMLWDVWWVAGERGRREGRDRGRRDRGRRERGGEIGGGGRGEEG